MLILFKLDVMHLTGNSFLQHDIIDSSRTFITRVCITWLLMHSQLQTTDWFYKKRKNFYERRKRENISDRSKGFFPYIPFTAQKHTIFCFLYILGCSFFTQFFVLILFFQGWYVSFYLFFCFLWLSEVSFFCLVEKKYLSSQLTDSSFFVILPLN